MTEIYIQKPVEISAIEVKWENETRIREFLREGFDQHGFTVVYVHETDDERWVEAHRHYFSRIGISGRWGHSKDNEFYAIEGDWLVQARAGGRVEVIKPQEFRKLYEKKSDTPLLMQPEAETVPTPIED